jgi:zinc transporter 1/2/3
LLDKIYNVLLKAGIRGFLVILALSLHAVFEGVALGLTHTTGSVWLIFFAIASHKFVISFCIGMQFVTSGERHHPH